MPRLSTCIVCTHENHKITHENVARLLGAYLGTNCLLYHSSTPEYLDYARFERFAELMVLRPPLPNPRGP